MKNKKFFPVLKMVLILEITVYEAVDGIDEEIVYKSSKKTREELFNKMLKLAKKTFDVQYESYIDGLKYDCSSISIGNKKAKNYEKTDKKSEKKFIDKIFERKTFSKEKDSYRMYYHNQDITHTIIFYPNCISLSCLGYNDESSNNCTKYVLLEI